MNFIKKYKAKLLNDPYFVQSAVLFFFTVLVYVGQYIYQIYVNRNLSKDDFGLLNTFFSLTMILGFSGKVAKTWLNKIFSEIKISHRYDTVRPVIMHYFKIMTFFILILAVVFTIFRGPLSAAYKIDRSFYIYILFFMLFINYSKLPFMAFLESFKKFKERGIGEVLMIGVLLLVTFIFLMTQFGFIQFLFAKIIASFVSALLSVFFVYRIIKSGKRENTASTEIEDGGHKSMDLSFAYKIGIAMLLQTLLVNIDMQIARINLTPQRSGDFATMRVLGMMIFYLGNVTLPLFFVSMNELFYAGKSMTRQFLKGIGLVILVISAAVAGLFLFIEPVVSVFNRAYVNIVPNIKFYALTTIPYIFIMYMIHLFISLNKYKFFIVVAGLTLLLSGTYFLYGKSIEMILWIKFIGGIVVFTVAGVYILFLKKKKHAGYT